MPLRAVQSRSLADQVFEQLASEIVTRRYAAGENLPAERTLAEVFGVNRHVVREATKRLEQLGLVRVSQGGGTRVLDFERHAGLDLLSLMAQHAREGADVAAYWLAVLQMRATLAVDLVRLCALRASPEVRRDLLAISERMRGEADPAALFDLEVAFWERVHDGAQNIAYRLAFNSLLKGVSMIPDTARDWTLREIQLGDYHRPVVQAIAEGNTERAEQEARRAMRGWLVAVEGAPSDASREAPAAAAAPVDPGSEGSRTSVEASAAPQGTRRARKA